MPGNVGNHRARSALERLCGLDDDRLQECIPDDLVPDLLHLTERLPKAVISGCVCENSRCISCQRMLDWTRDFAWTLAANIIRAKGKPGTTYAIARYFLSDGNILYTDVLF